MSDNNIIHHYINTVITDISCPGGIRLLRGCRKTVICFIVVTGFVRKMQACSIQTGLNESKKERQTYLGK